MPDDDCETRARGHSGGGWARPGGVAATPIAQTAPARSWRDLTSGEADAWREGWRAAQAAAVARLRGIAESYDANDLPDGAAFRAAAREVERMPMPAARREPTGLEVRGG